MPATAIPTPTALEIFVVEVTTAKGWDLMNLMIAATKKVINSEHNELAT